MKRILAAVDGSEASMRAVELAAQLAAKFQAELILVDVVEHGTPPDWALPEYVRLDQFRNNMRQFAESLARDTLENARAHALAHGSGPVRSEIRFGDAAEEILKCREETGADAVVVSSRGHGRLAGLLLGSVSQKIASLAPCIVAIAR
jgi:nucleotide-binding universal stress UspA family protein